MALNLCIIFSIDVKNTFCYIIQNPYKIFYTKVPYLHVSSFTIASYNAYAVSLQTEQLMKIHVKEFLLKKNKKSQ